MSLSIGFISLEERRGNLKIFLPEKHSLNGYVYEFTILVHYREWGGILLNRKGKVIKVRSVLLHFFSTLPLNETYIYSQVFPVRFNEEYARAPMLTIVKLSLHISYWFDSILKNNFGCTVKAAHLRGLRTEMNLSRGFVARTCLNTARSECSSEIILF